MTTYVLSVCSLSSWHSISQSSMTPILAMCGHLLPKACPLLKSVIFHCQCCLHFWPWLSSRNSACIIPGHRFSFQAFRSCASRSTSLPTIWLGPYQKHFHRWHIWTFRMHQLWNLNLQRTSQMLVFSRSIRRASWSIFLSLEARSSCSRHSDV